MLHKLIKCFLIYSFTFSQLCFILFVICTYAKNADIAVESFAGFIAFGLASVGLGILFEITKK